MSRYFFDVFDGRSWRDESGIDCADDEAARRMALQSIPGLAADLIDAPGCGHNLALTIRIRRENGTSLYSGTFTYLGTNDRR